MDYILTQLSNITPIQEFILGILFLSMIWIGIQLVETAIDIIRYNRDVKALANDKANDIDIIESVNMQIDTTPENYQEVIKQIARLKDKYSIPVIDISKLVITDKKLKDFMESLPEDKRIITVIDTLYDYYLPLLSKSNWSNELIEQLKDIPYTDAVNKNVYYNSNNSSVVKVGKKEYYIIGINDFDYLYSLSGKIKGRMIVLDARKLFLLDL